MKHKRQKCIVNGCECVADFCKYKSKTTGQVKYYYKKTCAKHNLDGGLRYNQTQDARILRLWKSCGIDFSLKEYHKLYQQQEGCCAICGKFKEKLNIDHNHKNNQLRSLLCTYCNFVVGIVENYPALIEKVKQYLQSFNWPASPGWIPEGMLESHSEEKRNLV